MSLRRNLTPPIGTPIPGLPPTRRAGGARRNVSYRLLFLRNAKDGAARAEITGWALNISRGGLRAIVEEALDLGEELDVSIDGDEEQVTRRAQVVWTQEEPDGMIVGLSFLERLEDAPPGMDLDASVEIAPGSLAKTLEMGADELSGAMAEAVQAGKTPPDEG